MHRLAFYAAPERVCQVLTAFEGIRHWRTRDAELDSWVGGTGEFRFYEMQRVTRVRVDEIIPSARVRWTTIASFRPEWEGTVITFDLRAGGDGTVLAFAHCGFAQVDETYALTTTGWGTTSSACGSTWRPGRVRPARMSISRT